LRIPSLDGFRAFSIVLVVGSHLSSSHTVPADWQSFIEIFDGKISNGSLGVRIFFCISGFLITTLLMKEKANRGRIDLRNFYARRFLKIVPVSYVYIFFLYMLSRIYGLRISDCEFLTALTYTKNYACAGFMEGHLWSLSVEEQFYLIWPAVVYMLPNKKAILVCVLFILISPLSRLIEFNIGAPIWWMTSHTDALMLGGLAALSFNLHPELKSIFFKHAFLGRAIAAFSLFAPIMFFAYLPLVPVSVMLSPLVQSVAATYLICSYIYNQTGMFYFVLNARIVTLLGVCSYSIYVWQEIFFLSPHDQGSPGWIVFYWPYNIVGILLAGILSYLCIEKPLLGLRGRLRPSVDQLKENVKLA
jgi:peptidoglycan/LPS O-acetylase OafA/YrhL